MTVSLFNREWRVRPKVSPFAQLRPDGQQETPVTLPHDVVIGLERSADKADGRTGYFPGGAFEYLKTFDAPSAWRDKRVTIEFEGVYRDAMVFVNGTFAAQQPNGYTTFHVPLDAYLNYGGSNTIRVDVRAHDDSRWYTGAGIHRNVNLIVSELVHVDHAGPRISTPDIDEERAVVAVVTPVINESTLTETVRVLTELIDARGDIVALDSAPLTLRAGSAGVVRQRLYVTEPALWGVDHPELYTARTTLTGDTGELGSTVVPVGIRSLRLDPTHGLRINGEVIKLRGACIHHDNGPLGAAAIDRAEERRIQLLKEAGFNAIRSAHNQISPALLRACDRLGMLVMDEFSDVWTDAKSAFDYSLTFPEWWARDIASMIAKDFNHPSVIFYSIGNEIFETGNALGAEWGRTLAEHIRGLDDTRYVTNGINPFVSVISDVISAMNSQSSSPSEDGGVNALLNGGDFMANIATDPGVTKRTESSFSVLDVAGLNYGDARYEGDRTEFPNRIIVGTETFAPRIANNWRLVLDNAHVIGDFTWTGWDYLGEVGIGATQYADTPREFEAPYPWLSARSGDIDITGLRRPISFYRETVFGLTSDPYIAVLRPQNHGREIIPGMWAWSDSISSWSWDVAHGAPVSVEVYSDGDEVELSINGRPLGRTAPGKNLPFVAEFEAVYEPGELQAISYRDGVEIGRTSLISSHGPVEVVVTPDRANLRADDTDLSFLTIELRDAGGNLASATDALVRVSIDGPGELQALGSARPDTEEQFISGEHSTFDGRALAVVRPTGLEGPIKVTVAVDGFSAVTVELQVDSDSAVPNPAEAGTR
ncbi:glycoside hydrolase family 2 TIM barrel-domain containing protein (plasmid) [Arthrobacter sp. G.S.26]|uniref:glycoside hydrolase family 2 TIM barrel-domain containing protein n=1 Tax=Arthrobacter sp. G.S.26 TaxID=3433706 RepID=UPI003D783E56